MKRQCSQLKKLQLELEAGIGPILTIRRIQTPEQDLSTTKLAQPVMHNNPYEPWFEPFNQFNICKRSKQVMNTEQISAKL